MAVFSGNGSANTPSFTFSSDTNLGLFRGAADALSITTTGIERARFDAAGALEIGGTLGSAPNITLNSSGLGEFGGGVKVTGGTLEVTPGVTVINTPPTATLQDLAPMVVKADHNGQFVSQSINFASSQPSNVDFTGASSSNTCTLSSFRVAAGFNVSYRTNPDVYCYGAEFIMGAAANGNTYNIHASGSAPNFLKGNTLIGGTDALPNISLNANGSAEFAGDIESTSQNGGQLAGFRNLLINGDLRIWQRGGNFPASSGAKYTADHWRIGANRQATRVNFNNKFGAEIGNDGTTGPVFGQPIEIDVSGRPGPFVEGTTYTFSCVIKASATTDIQLSIQNRISADDNTGAQDVVPLTTIATGVQSPQTVSYTFTYTSAMRPTTNKTCTYVEVRTTDGSGTMTVTDLQLEPGSGATPYEIRPIGTELALCQRYYYQYDNGGVVDGGLFMTTFMGGTATRSGYSSTHPQTMRVAPTVTNLSVRDHPSANATDTSAEYLALRSEEDSSSSNRFPTIFSFNVDAEL